MVTLLEELTGGREWPPPRHAERIAEQADYQRLYRNDDAELRQYWSLELVDYIADGELIPYPSVQLASRIIASFLFGEDPELRATVGVEPEVSEPDPEAPDPADDAQELLSAWVEETTLPATLHEGATTCAAQGEVYLRPSWNRDLLGRWPRLTVLPGRRVVPRFSHGVLVEGVVVSEVEGTSSDRYWRLLEHHTPGRIETAVHYGTSDRLGDRVSPESDGVPPGWAELPEAVDTQVDELLLTHVPFLRDSESPHGRSLFDGKVGLVLALHRLYSQEQHDAELARYRIAVPSSYLKRGPKGDPRWDRRTDLLELDESAAGPVGAERPLTPIQFRDDNVQRERIQGRIRDLLLACGIAPQTLGEESGGAESGTARRLAQALTIQTVSAAARYWRSGLPRAIRQTLEVGRIHLDLDVPTDLAVSVSLADGFVDDPREEAETIATLDSAQAISTEEKVRRLHPEWSEEQVAAEVERIGGDNPQPPSFEARGSIAGLGASGNGQEPETEPVG